MLCLIVLLVARVPAFAADDGAPGEKDAADAAAQDSGLKYEPTIAGVANSDLYDLLKSSSQLFSLIDRQPATIASLERRAQSDLARLGEALRSEGYYDASLSYHMERNKTPIPVPVHLRKYSGSSPVEGALWKKGSSTHRRRLWFQRKTG